MRFVSTPRNELDSQGRGGRGCFFDYLKGKGRDTKTSRVPTHTTRTHARTRARMPPFNYPRITRTHMHALARARTHTHTHRCSRASTCPARTFIS